MKRRTPSTNAENANRKRRVQEHRSAHHLSATSIQTEKLATAGEEATRVGYFIKIGGPPPAHEGCLTQRRSGRCGLHINIFLDLKGAGEILEAYDTLRQRTAPAL